MFHAIAHVLGIDTQQSWAYDYWSGVGTQLNLPVLAGVAAYLHKHNCHHRRCPLLGKHHVDGTPYCTRHHPRRSTGLAPAGAPEEEGER